MQVGDRGLGRERGGVLGMRACGTRWWSWQARLQFDEPAGGVVHLTHGQAEPVPEKPEPLTAGPGDQLFGALHLAFGDVGVVHSVPFCSGEARPVRTAGDPWSAARSPSRLCYYARPARPSQV